jgi:inner membrane protein
MLGGFSISSVKGHPRLSGEMPRSSNYNAILVGRCTYMDLITHILAGASISRCGLNRKTTAATATLVLAAVLPDIDILYGFNGANPVSEHHRGITHSLVAVPVLAGVAVAMVWAFQRWRRTTPSAPPRWRLLYAGALLGVCSHLLLDLSMSYGLRPFAPFSYKWYSWDIALVIEPYITLLLLLGIALPSALAVLGRRCGRTWSFKSQTAAVLGLTGVLGMWALRGIEHQRAVSELYRHQYAGARPLRASAYPYALTPFLWHGVVESDTFFESVNVTSSGLQRETARVYRKMEVAPAIIAARASELGRICMERARYPVFEEASSGPDHIVRLYDLRWVYPSDVPPFACVVRLDPQLRVVDQAWSQAQSVPGSTDKASPIVRR